MDPIQFDAQGRVTVPSSWFTPNELVGGKIRATPTGQVMGLIAEWGRQGRGAMTRGVTLNPGSTELGDLAQSLVWTADMEPEAEPIAATLLAYAADHYDGPALSNPLNAMILARPFLTPRGIGIAGCVHPEAVARWGLGEAVGRINTTPWSLEGARFRDTGRVRIGSTAAPGVLGTAVTAPGFALERLAAADTPEVEGIVFDSTPEPTPPVAPVVEQSAEPAVESVPISTIMEVVDQRVTERVTQVLADQAAQAEREARRAAAAELLRQPIG